MLESIKKKLESIKKNMKTKSFKIISLLFFIFLFAFVANAQNGDDSNKTGTTAENQEKDRPLKIIKKAQPSIDNFRECFISLRVTHLSGRVKVTFHSSGKITGVEIVAPSGCEEFDKESLRVARKIKFEPAIKNGEAVTETKSVEYKAGIY